MFFHLAGVMCSLLDVCECKSHPARCGIDSPSKAGRLFSHRAAELQGVTAEASSLAPPVCHPNRVAQCHVQTAALALSLGALRTHKTPLTEGLTALTLV